MSDQDDVLETLLSDGWQVAGYSTSLMAAGAILHSILIKKDNAIKSVTIITNAGSEVGRTVHDLSPKPAAKKGWF